MKKVHILIFSCFLLFVTGGCSKDLGNYDYKEINEVTIAGIEPSYRVNYENQLQITPDLSFTEANQSPDRYTYEWKLVPSLPYSDEDWRGVILGTERNLDLLVKTFPGTYSLYYKVRDTQTEVSWSARTALTVSTQTATGFLIVGEDEEGYAALDMIAIASGKDTLILTGLMEDKGLPKFKGAVNVFHTGGSSRAKEAKMWIAGTEEGYYLNTSTFESSVDKVFKKLTFSSYPHPSNMHPVDYAPKTAAFNGSVSGSQRVIVTNTGDLFTTSIIAGDFYGNPINRLSVLDGTPLIKLAPYILHGGTSALSGYVVYDRDANRFLRTQMSSSDVLTVMADREGDSFPWNQPAGRTLVYAENTKNTDGGGVGNVFALMKDENNRFYIYKFAAYGTPAKRDGYTVPAQFNTTLANSSLFAFASRRSAMYFAIGSKLYAYDYNKGNEAVVLIKDFGEEITMLHSDIQASSTSLDLYVATYSATHKGSIRKMILQSNTNTIELKEDETVAWRGLSKIKRMSWKNTTH